MKYLFFILATCFFISCQDCFFISCQDNQNNERVLILGLDGISVEGLQKAKTPNLDALFAEGMFSKHTRAVMPSVTLPNWTSHLTGSGPEQHGVNSNKWTLGNHTLPPLDKDSKGYYPSIFKVLKAQIPNIKTSFYYNWANLINPINKAYLDAFSYEENDAFHENYSKAMQFMETNRDVPSLTFLYSGHTDHAGHKYKWMSDEYIHAIEKADTAIGQFIESLKEKNLFKDTHFLFITDHGGIGNGHGGMTIGEMEVPWGIVGKKINKGKLIQPNSNTNTSLAIAKIFGCKQIPDTWIGHIPKSIFK